MTPTQPDPVTPPASCPVCGAGVMRRTGRWMRDFACGAEHIDGHFGPCPRANDVALALRQRVQALERQLPPGQSVTLSKAEATELLRLLDEISGGNLDNFWSPERDDDPSDPAVTGMAKLFRAAGRPVPRHLEGNTDVR